MRVEDPLPGMKPGKTAKLRIGRDVHHEALYSYEFHYTSDCDPQGPIKPDPSLARMLISDPPIADLRLLASNFPRYRKSSSPRLFRAQGIRFQELWSLYIDCMKETRIGKKRRMLSKFAAIGSLRWFATERDVDCITGWEMLELLRTSQEKRKEGWKSKSVEGL